MKKKLNVVIRTMCFSFFLLVGFSATPLLAQRYGDLEKDQDKIEELNVHVYEIIRDYPGASYDYVRKDGKVADVVITGIPKGKVKDQLRLYLIDLNNLRESILNTPNRFGVHYVTETQPKPEMGYKKLYDQLYASLEYPENAKDEGVEGSVYVKFIVEADGEVSHVITANTLEPKQDWVVKEVTREAKDAVMATSGKWIPAKLGGVAVSQWMVLPVEFKLEGAPFFPASLY